MEELPKLLGERSLKADESLLDTAADFVMPEKKLKALTGLFWEGLIALRERLSSLRNSSTRTIIQALVIFLFKMRSGNSNSIIAAVFEIDRKQQVSDSRHSVFSSFETDILPKNFRLHNADRNDLVQNKTSC